MFEEWGFDAITLNPYLGRESFEPYLEYEGKGFYMVCRTSNPGAADLQYVKGDGLYLYERVAQVVTSWSPNIGLVVGATAPAELRRVRELVPAASLLVPGVGAQGGQPSEVMQAAGTEPGSIVVSATRSIMYASDGPDFAEASARAARALRDQLTVAPSTA